MRAIRIRFLAAGFAAAALPAPAEPPGNALPISPDLVTTGKFGGPVWFENRRK